MLPKIISHECKGFFPNSKRWQHIDWLSLSMPSSAVPALHEYLNRLINKLGLGWIRGGAPRSFLNHSLFHTRESEFSLATIIPLLIEDVQVSSSPVSSLVLLAKRNCSHFCSGSPVKDSQ